MPAYTTPGVYVSESALSSLTPTLTGITAAVFFGEAERGPTSATLIQDWTTYKRVYGDLKNAYDLGYAVYHYFANGGRACYVVRVAASDAVTAVKDDFPYEPNGDGNASPLFDVEAISDGAWGNNVTVEVTGGLTATSNEAHGTFTIIVKLNGTEVERWPEVTLDTDGNRYVQTVVNTYSNYIRLTNVSEVAPDVSLVWDETAYSLSLGSDGTIADSDYVSAIDAIDGINGNLILNAVGKTSGTIVTATVNKAAARGDSFVVIDPEKTDDNLTATQTTAATFAGQSNGGYAAHYAPALKMVDPGKTGPGAIRDTYPGGAVAGLIVRTEIQRSVAKAPAGVAADIRGALGTVYSMSNDDIGTLYDGSPYVNSFKAIPGAGVAVYGARTLAKTTADKFIPVRRTLNYLKSSLKDLTQFAVFEPNDENLWSRINVVTSSFLANFYREGGLKGENASQAFYVVCDSTNNTETSIDQGIVNVEVGVALQYPAEFIVINLSQWTGGSNAAES
jgi:hypothetical protein